MKDRLNTSCNDPAIQELLPELAAGVLSADDQQRVERHTASCADCSAELALLRVLAQEPVPDPGQAFWSSFPDRVHRAVQKENSARRMSGGRWWPFPAIAPPWSWAAAAAVLTAIVWLAVSVNRPSPGIQTAGGIGSDEQAGYTEALNLDELNGEEMTALDAWAGREYTALSRETALALQDSQETDLSEEISGLGPAENEQLLKLIDLQRKETRT